MALFDCLHDMGHPAGVAGQVHETLGPDGAWLVVEPRSGDTVAENLNPVGRICYAASAIICTPCSQAQEVGAARGAQAGEERLADVIRQGGFRIVRRAAETPFNLIREARKSADLNSAATALPCLAHRSTVNFSRASRSGPVARRK